jgi:hypothetical protein
MPARDTEHVSKPEGYCGFVYIFFGRSNNVRQRCLAPSGRRWDTHVRCCMNAWEAEWHGVGDDDDGEDMRRLSALVQGISLQTTASNPHRRIALRRVVEHGSSTDTEDETCDDAGADAMEIVTEDGGNTLPFHKPRVLAALPTLPIAAALELFRAICISCSVTFLAALVMGPPRPYCLLLATVWIVRRMLGLRSAALPRPLTQLPSGHRKDLPSPEAMRIVARGGGAGMFCMLAALRAALVIVCVELLVRDTQTSSMYGRWTAL